MRILVFDTETTGLLPKNYKEITLNTSIFYKKTGREWHTLFPYIVQCSWIVYDTSTNTLDTIQDHIIRLPQGVRIPKESSNVHGITDDIMEKDGESITEVLQLFIESLHSVDKIVAHNIDFDATMLRVEFARNGIMNHMSLFQKKMYCTMKNTIDYCALERTSAYTGKKYFKYPQLNELHHKMFGYMLNNLHNSLYDVIVCLRCYMYYVHKEDVLKTCEFIQNIYESLV